MRRCALFTLWILTIAAPASAAPQLPALLPVECDRLIELLLATTAPDDRRRVAEALVDMTSHTQCLADAMMQRAAFPSFLKLLETLRTDKQSGASAGTGGSTNLVSKGTTAKIGQLLAKSGYSLSFTAPVAGTVTIQWYYLPAGSRLLASVGATPKPILVATGKHSYSKAGKATIKVKLSGAARKLMRKAKSLKITGVATLTRSGKAKVTATKTFTLKK